MEKAVIIEKVNSFLEEDFETDLADISLNANMHETLELDSLDYVDMIVSVERTFGFKMKGDDFKGMHTFDDFYNFRIR